MLSLKFLVSIKFNREKKMQKNEKLRSAVSIFFGEFQR